MRAVASILAFLASAVLAGSVSAANQKDLRDCDQSRDDVRIAGCTRVINSGDVSVRTLASAYNKRAIALKKFLQCVSV